MSTYVPQPPPRPTVDVEPTKKRGGRGRSILGVLLLIAGLAGAAALVLGGNRNVNRAVDCLGRFKAPNTARLAFKKSGTFTVYFENQSRITERSCANGTVTDRFSAPAAVPGGLDISLNDGGGQSVGLSDATGASYSRRGKHGVPIRVFEIATPGDYEMTVASDNQTAFAIAVGRGTLPKLTPYLIGAAGSAIGGLVLGSILMAAGRRRTRRLIQAVPAVPVGYGVPVAAPGWSQGQWSPAPPSGSPWTPAPPPTGAAGWEPAPPGGGWNQPTAPASGAWTPPPAPPTQSWTPEPTQSWTPEPTQSWRPESTGVWPYVPDAPAVPEVDPTASWSADRTEVVARTDDDEPEATPSPWAPPEPPGQS